MTESTSLRATELSDDGGHFYSADFQVPTPRDTQRDGARPQSEGERESWADNFVAAARTKELNAVAISDHHDFGLFPHFKRAAQRELSENGDGRPERERLVLAACSAQRESELPPSDGFNS
jgi:chromosome segregation protein